MVSHLLCLARILWLGCGRVEVLYAVLEAGRVCIGLEIELKSCCFLLFRDVPSSQLPIARLDDINLRLLLKEMFEDHLVGLRQIASVNRGREVANSATSATRTLLRQH